MLNYEEPTFSLAKRCEACGMFQVKHLLSVKTSLLFLSLLVAGNLLAGELPETVLPAGVGVNIHFTRGHEADLDKIKEAGFKFIRMDFTWGGIERKKGEYDWSAYDELTANLEKRGIRPYYILDYSNPLYEETIVSKDPATKKETKTLPSPQHPESVAAFARWAAASAKHLQGRHVIWEIWNEPNIGFWKPKPDAHQYATLAMATLKAIRNTDPQATIVGPASSTFPWEFHEVLYQAGALQYLDAVSVHPYRGGPPETAAADFLKLHGLIARYAPASKKNMPILSGEWGYSTNEKGVPLDRQAEYLARQQLGNLLAGVPLSIWYDWRNDGPDPRENEHNFGTVTTDLKPKPSYNAAKTLTHQLSGYRIARRLETGDTDDYALLCVNSSGAQKLVVWTTVRPHVIELEIGPAGVSSISGVDYVGSSITASVSGNRLKVQAGNGPAYFTLSKATDYLKAAATWEASLPDGILAEGGVKGIRTDVRLVNPLKLPARVELKWQLATGESAGSKSFVMEPGEIVHHQFTLPFYRRDQENGEIIIQARFADAGSGQVIGHSSQRLAYLPSNPLHFTVAPVEDGLQLEFHNPSKKAFNGMVSAGESTQPVNIASGQTNLVIHLSEKTISRAGNETMKVYDREKHLVAESAAVNYRPVNIKMFHAAVDGDQKVPAKATIVEAVAPSPAPYGKAFKLDYEFAEGWRFVRCAPTAKQPAGIKGQPEAIGFWVYGDNSGNGLRLRMADASGQTFQCSGPRIDWSGWRWITIKLNDLAKSTAHWGGANDGVPHGNLHWDCPILLDGTRVKTKGTVYFTGLQLIYP